MAEDEDFKRADISVDSIIMKFENNRYLDTKGEKGLSNYSKKNKKVFNEWTDCSIEMLENEIMKEQKRIRR